MADFAFVTHTVEGMMNRWESFGTIDGHTIASPVAHGAAHWEEELPSGASTRLCFFLARQMFSRGVRYQSVS